MVFKKVLNNFAKNKNNSQSDNHDTNSSITEPTNKSNILQYREIRYKRAPRWSRSIQWSIVGAVTFGLIYSVVARIDEVVIARGDLQPDGAERPIKAPIAGVVKKIIANEGEEVRIGDKLIVLDSEVNEGRINSLNAQLTGEQSRLFSENESNKARLESLKAKMKSLKNSYRTSETILRRYDQLLDIGALSEVAYLEKKDQLQKLDADISQTQSGIDQASAEAANSEQLIKKEIQSIQRQLIESNKAKEYEVLKSPIDGYVFDLVPSSYGYAVTTGETLVKIVPNGPVVAKVFVTNTDIGFIKENMDVKVRVDAYPFTQFGELPGIVSSISTEAKEPDQNNPQSRFVVIVELKSQFLKIKNIQKKVKPGQSVSANFIVRDRPVISLLTDAIEKAFDSLRGIKTDQN